MIIHQRDIVWVNFLLNDGTMKPHMAVVVSQDYLHETTGDIYLVMISSKNHFPENTFPITDEMVLNMKFNKTSYVICHLLTGFTEQSIVSVIGKMRKSYFEKMIQKVLDVIFGEDMNL